MIPKCSPLPLTIVWMQYQISCPKQYVSVWPHKFSILPRNTVWEKIFKRWVNLLSTGTKDRSPALSAHFKVDGASRRVDGENDYIYYTVNSKIYQISKKVDGACGMSSWRNRCAPSLADNAAGHFPFICEYYRIVITALSCTGNESNYSILSGLLILHSPVFTCILRPTGG